MVRNSHPVKSCTDLYPFDQSIVAMGKVCIVGIDEAGRGPLAGPVVSGAVILDLDTPIPGINDSKKLSAAQREQLYDRITAQACAWGVGEASVGEIEELNILGATFLSMRRALEQIKHPWTLALVDGNQKLRGLAFERQQTVVKGDARSASIAAASILAKVTRDRIMKNYHERFPMYDFNSNKGYGTERHRKGILEFGMCEIHRPSFCEKIISQTCLDL